MKWSRIRVLMKTKMAATGAVLSSACGQLVSKQNRKQVFKTVVLQMIYFFIQITEQLLKGVINSMIIFVEIVDSGFGIIFYPKITSWLANG